MQALCLVVLEESHLERGAWIEMHLPVWKVMLLSCRTSKEVRGLKLEGDAVILRFYWSHLERGAWIEILLVLMAKLSR